MPRLISRISSRMEACQLGSTKRCRFNNQHPHNGPQPPVMLVPGHRHPLLPSTGTAHMWCTSYKQGKYTEIRTQKGNDSFKSEVDWKRFGAIIRVSGRLKQDCYAVNLRLTWTVWVPDQGWGNGSTVTSTGYSANGPRSSSHHAHGSSSSRRSDTLAQTYMQAKPQCTPSKK